MAAAAALNAWQANGPLQLRTLRVPLRVKVRVLARSEHSMHTCRLMHTCTRKLADAQTTRRRTDTNVECSCAQVLRTPCPLQIVHCDAMPLERAPSKEWSQAAHAGMVKMPNCEQVQLRANESLFLTDAFHVEVRIERCAAAMQTTCASAQEDVLFALSDYHESGVLNETSVATW